MRLLIVFLAGLFLSGTANAQVIGGFDAGRGGTFSLASGSEFGALRTAILAEYPEAQFTGNPVLDTSYLSGLDLLLVGSALSNVSGITPLSAAEQSALSLYVQAGGAAIVLTDNDTLTAIGLANASFDAVFGVTTTGTVSGNQPATVVVQDHPITDGPHGSVSAYITIFPGWFAAQGSATVLARLDNAPAMAPTCLWFGPGAFMQGTGTALLLSDHAFPAEFVLNMIAFQLARSVPLMSLYGWLGLVAGLMAASAFALRLRARRG